MYRLILRTQVSLLLPPGDYHKTGGSLQPLTLCSFLDVLSPRSSASSFIYMFFFFYKCVQIYTRHTGSVFLTVFTVYSCIWFSARFAKLILLGMISQDFVLNSDGLVSVITVIPTTHFTTATIPFVLVPSLVQFMAFSLFLSYAFRYCCYFTIITVLLSYPISRNTVILQS